MNRKGRISGFGKRMLVAQALVILAGSTSMLVVALTVAQVIFHRHLGEAAGPLPEDVARHVDVAFSRSILIALGLAVAAASLTALTVGLFVTRRVLRPIQAMAGAAELISGGNYGTRISPAGLGSEFTSLERAFNDMAATLAATERTRAEILRDLAHEFRTPLTTVRGYSEAMADGVLTADAHTWHIIEAEVARMERLVHDIALVSSAEERHLHLERKDMSAAELVRDAVSAADATFELQGVRLTAQVDEGSLVVSVDDHRIQEVLANLLDNALRHTPSGGEVRVTAKRQQDQVELAVSDTGEGIGAEHLPRVFERFYRAGEGRSRDQGGTGIGLAIARALVEAHGGHIQARSPGPGKGSTFTVSLPTTQTRLTS